MAIIRGSVLLDVNELLQKAAAAVRGLCRFVIDDAAANFATGFLVAPDVVLTAAHVFFQGDGSALAERMHERVTIEFDDVAGVKLHESWLLSPSSLQPDRLDYALVRLAQPVNRAEIGIPAPGEAPLLVPQTEVYVLQFVDRHAPRISMGHVMDVSADRMRVYHTASTLPGASGSPMFDTSFRLAAIHIERPSADQPHNCGLPIRQVSREIGTCYPPAHPCVGSCP